MQDSEFEKPIKETFPVTGMSCAGCAGSVESILSQVEGVTKAQVNFASSSVLVEKRSDVAVDVLQKALQAVGFDLIVNEEDPIGKQEAFQQQEYDKVKKRSFWSAVLTFPIFIIGMFYMDWELGKWVSFILSIPVLFYFGKGFFIHAWQQAKQGKTNMDTLVAMSTGIAFIFSLFNTVYSAFWTDQGLVAHVYYEAATVIITFISFGKLLEEKAKTNTSSAIKKLMGLQVNTVSIVSEGEEHEIPLSLVQKGNEIIVKPGGKIPVDGEVISGNSFVDESMITGEPIALEKTPGKKVFAGTINQKGNFHFIAEKVGKDTFLAQIIKQVQEAQGSKAPVQKMVDKIASIFVPTIILIAIITFLVWMLFGGENALTHALLSSITVLIIACPCALGLATPTAIMVGVGKGAENNILIKDAESLELALKVNAVVLDKTGTITEGRPSVSDWFWKEESSSTQKWEEILMAMELKSEHPLAEAVVDVLKKKNVLPSSLSEFESVTGKGVKAKSADGDVYFVGNKQMLVAHDIVLSGKLLVQSEQLQQGARTVVYFANEKEVLATIGVRDQLKETSKEGIGLLQSKGIEVYMLTGDNAATAKAVGDMVGISSIMSEVLPSGKADFIKKLQSDGKIVAMVGDGINDSEALAQSDVSIAMGQGADIAMDIAKITLITSDLRSVSKALNLSRKTVLGIKQNLFWAFVYNLIGIPLAAGILYPINGFLLDPMIAGGAMALSSVSVVLNSLRLKTIQL